MNTFAAAFRWAIRQRPVCLLVGFFIGQAVITLAVTRKEAPLNVLPLRTFAERIGDWEIYQDGVIDKEMQSILHPDDYLLRQYITRDRSLISTVFVAYFKSQ